MVDQHARGEHRDRARDECPACEEDTRLYASTPESALGVAIAALERISDPAQTSMRRRDPNCVRYVASDTLTQLEELGHTTRGLRWERFESTRGIEGKPA